MDSVVGQQIACWRCYAVIVAQEGELLQEHTRPGTTERCPCSGTPFPRCTVPVMIPTIWPVESQTPIDPAVSGGDAAQITIIGYTPDPLADESQRITNCQISYTRFDVEPTTCDCPRHNPTKYGISE